MFSLLAQYLEKIIIDTGEAEWLCHPVPQWLSDFAAFVSEATTRWRGTTLLAAAKGVGILLDKL